MLCVCGKRLAVYTCKWCGVALCSECFRFDLLGSGCGSVHPIYGCEKCLKDPAINPFAF